MSLIFDEQNTSIDSGVWRDLNESKFLIASSASLKFVRTLTRLQKPHRRKIDRNEMDPGEMQNILIQAISESVLLDWKGVKNREGAEVEYTPERGRQALKNNPAFREFVMEVSSDLGNFQAEEREHEVKS